MTMSNHDLAQEPNWFTGRLRNASFLRRQLPYLAVLVLAIAGVAYTNISHQPLVGYWEFLVVATGVMCVVTQSPHLSAKSGHLEVRRQCQLLTHCGHPSFGSRFNVPFESVAGIPQVGHG